MELRSEIEARRQKRSRARKGPRSYGEGVLAHEFGDAWRDGVTSMHPRAPACLPHQRTKQVGSACTEGPFIWGMERALLWTRSARKATRNSQNVWAPGTH